MLDMEGMLKVGKYFISIYLNKNDLIIGLILFCFVLLRYQSYLTYVSVFYYKGFLY
jgi:hypothetical protein